VSPAEAAAAAAQARAAANAPVIPTPSGPSAPAAPPQTSAGGAVPQPAGGGEKIAKLMALGFPRAECEQALAVTGGNEDMAAALLFGMT
jgi:DNA damage-inducible protein 1